MKNFMKYLAAAAIGAAAAFFVLYLGLSFLLTRSTLKIGGDPEAVPAAALNAAYPDSPGDAIIEKRCVTAEDGTNLTALCWRQPEDSGRWAIIVHGYTSSKENMLSYARRYYSQGWSVLLPDLRGHGESGGLYTGMGWLDKDDLFLWLDGLESGAEVVLHGISMGAAAVLMASGEPMPESVRAIVSDCAFTDVAAIFAYQLEQKLCPEARALVGGSSLLSRLTAGYSWKEASALTQVAKSDTPTLFIHGAADDFVPPSMARELYEAAACKKELLFIDGAGHARSSQINAEKYWSAVFDFIENQEK